MARAVVYKIENTVDGRFYVGSTAYPRRRWPVHRTRLRNGKHPIIRLQRAWNKYGEAAFVYAVIEHCSKQKRWDREQYWLTKLDAANPLVGYNRSRFALGNAGWKHKPETLALFTKQRKGKKKPPFSPEHCAAISASRIGNQWAKGCTRSPATRAKIGAANRGRENPAVAASNKRRKGQPNPKVSVAQNKMWATRSHQRKMARRFTPEVRAKMSASAKARCNRKPKA